MCPTCTYQEKVIVCWGSEQNYWKYLFEKQDDRYLTHAIEFSGRSTNHSRQTHTTAMQISVL